MNMKKICDPFTYYSGGVTLAAGLVAMAVMVAVARMTGQTFRGVLSIGLGDLPLWRLALQRLAGWAVLSAVLYGAAAWFSSSRVRVIDVAGNQALALLPFAVLLLLEMIPGVGIPEELAEQLKQGVADPALLQPTAGMLVFGIVSVVVLVWFFAWSWRGFSVAANLRGAKAVGIYVCAFLLSEVLAGWCTAALLP